jgi:N-acyl-D-amino-acid deacylase
MFDLLIKNADVIDGTGSPRNRADVAISGDRIAAVGDLQAATAASVIDAAGLVVAPGFIDVHNHSDGWLLKDPHQTSKTLQGFTTEVLMSDGISYAPLVPELAASWFVYLRSLDGLQLSDYRGWRTIGDYMALLDGRTAQNVVAQVPYANVRVLAKGWDRHPPDDGQMRNIQHEITSGLEQGAVGVSTGLDYISQCFTTTDELVEACSVMRGSKALYVTHVRYKKGLLAGVKEAVEIGRRAGVPVHVSHLKCETTHDTDELLGYIDRVACEQVDFSFDVYPYLPGSTMLSFYLPYEVWEDGPLSAIARLSSPELRRRLAASLAYPPRGRHEQVHIAWVGSKANRHLQGLTLAEFLASRDVPPADAICDLLIEENLAVLLVFHLGEDKLIEPMLQHDKFMLGSDGIFFADGVVHPRQYGSAPRILGRLVRERGLFTLEEAVRKMSGYPAERFGLVDRGVIRVGAFADVVALDPQTITDRATFAEPHQASEGVRHVLVNGVPIISDGKPRTDFGTCYPGRALKFRA